MQIWSQKLKNWFKNSAYLGFAVIFIFVGLGCASSRKTTKTETVATQSNDTATNEAGQNTETTVTSSDQQNRGVVNKSETTTTTTETKAVGHPGILSSTVHAIGWVIALPFRLVGGLIGWIF
jgi:cytoskeletal protein RodZ